MKKTIQPLVDKQRPNKSLSEEIYSSLPNIAPNLAALHKELLDCESRINGLDEQIRNIKNQLRPVKRLDRARGIKPQVTGGNRSFYKASLKMLEKQRFMETDNWSKKMKELGSLVKSDVRRTKLSFWEEKARSERYLLKNKALFTRRTKIFLSELQQSDSSKLNDLKNGLRIRNEQSIQFLKDFLSENDSSRILITAFNSHEKYRSSFFQLIKDLLTDWTPRSRNYNFNELSNQLILKTTGEEL